MSVIHGAVIVDLESVDRLASMRSQILMRTSVLVMPLLLAVGASVGAQPKSTEKQRPSKTRSSPVKNGCDMNRIFGETFNSGDLDALTNLYEPGATIIDARGKPATGTAAIRSALAGFLAAKGKMTIQQKHCVAAGDLVLLRVTWQLRGAGPDGKPLELAGDTAEVARRQPDGSWRYMVDHPFGAN